MPEPFLRQAQSSLLPVVQSSLLPVVRTVPVTGGIIAALGTSIGVDIVPAVETPVEATAADTVAMYEEVAAEDAASHGDVEDAASHADVACDQVADVNLAPHLDCCLVRAAL